MYDSLESDFSVFQLLGCSFYEKVLFGVLVANAYSLLAPTGQIIFYIIIDVSAIGVWRVICFTYFGKIYLIPVSRTLVMSNIVKGLVNAEIPQRVLSLIVLFSRKILQSVDIDNHNTLPFFPCSLYLVINPFAICRIASRKNYYTRTMIHRTINPTFDIFVTFALYLLPIIRGNWGISINDPHIADLLNTPRVITIVKAKENLSHT